MKKETKKITYLAMFAALAYVLTLVGRIPIVLFLKYDPKDFVIVLAAFLFGTLPAILVTAVVSFIEMFTISDTGFIGFVMNVVSTVAFIVPASYIYSKKKSTKSMALGLVVSTLFMTAIMILWNYVLTPLYMHIPRADVVKLLGPAILPFNIIKGLINSAIILIVSSKLLNSRRFNQGEIYDGSRINTKESSWYSISISLVLVIIALILYFIIK